MVTWQAPKADKVSKIVLKVVEEDFDNTYKNILIAFAVFSSRIVFGQGGWYQPPDAINH